MTQQPAFYTSASQLLQSPGASNLLKTAAVAANAVPPPWGQVLSAAIALVGESYAVIANYRSDVIATALVQLPKQYADPALKRLAQFGASDFAEALQSWIVYRSIGSGAKETAFRALRDASGINDKMRTRIAKEVRAAVLASGAPVWMADHAAYIAAWVESRRDWQRTEMESNAKKWRAAVVAGYPASTPESTAFADRLDRWKNGKPQIGPQAAQTSSGGLGIVFAGIAALALLAGRK